MLRHGRALAAVSRRRLLQAASKTVVTGTGIVGLVACNEYYYGKNNSNKYMKASIASCQAASSPAAGAAASSCSNQEEKNGSNRLTAAASASDWMIQLTGTIVPTLEATVRAIRLIRTVTLIILDYKFPSYMVLQPQQHQQLRTQQNSSSTNNEDKSNDASQEEQRQFWEKEVQRATRELKHAQEVYTTPEESSNETKKNGSSSTEQHETTTKITKTTETATATMTTSKDTQQQQHNQQQHSGDASKNKKYDDSQQGDESSSSTSSSSSSSSPPNSSRTIEQQIMKKEEQRLAVRRAAQTLSHAEQQLAQISGSQGNPLHRHAAERLLRLCRENGGAYIKIGQHLANMDYLIPREYIEVLSSLFSDAPQTDFSDVCKVIQEDLGRSPDELFDSFESEPIASASLAQVHVAYEKGTGRKLAIKVQHRGLRETSVGDLLALKVVLRAVEACFQDEFTWGWMADEIMPQLPLELDFVNEGKNSEKAAEYIRQAKFNCVVPKVLWDKTTSRILCMEFEEGFKATDIDAIERSGLKKKEVARIISSVFNGQMFLSGFVHCDPHPANCLLRQRNGKPQVVLVDHGLYKEIDPDFRLVYAKLWRSLMMAHVEGIKESCEQLGVYEMYPLLAAMLTQRPFDEILERSKSGAIPSDHEVKRASDMGANNAMVRGYAQRYLQDIIKMLDVVPRQMLLLLKLNDCLRHIDHSLGTPTNTLVVAGEYAARALYEQHTIHHPQQKLSSTTAAAASARSSSSSSLASFVDRWCSWFDYLNVLLRIQLNDFVFWYMTKFGTLSSSKSITL